MAQVYVVGDGSPFLKRVLVPFYIIRIAIMLLGIVFFTLMIVGAVYKKSSIIGGLVSNVSDAYTIVIAVCAVFLGVIVCSLVLDVVCMIKRTRRTLSPSFFLIANCVQTGIWTFAFIIKMAITAGGSPATTAVAVVIYASFIGLLIYSIVVYEMYRNGTLETNYERANLQPTEYGGGHGNSENITNEPKPYDPPTGYPQAYVPETRYR